MNIKKNVHENEINLIIVKQMIENTSKRKYVKHLMIVDNET